MALEDQVIEKKEAILERKNDSKLPAIKPDIETKIQKLSDQEILNVDQPMEVKIAIAARIATPLKELLDSQNLIMNLGKGEHVLIDGWLMLCTMLGCTPVTEWIEPMSENESDAKYAYRACVSIKKGDTILATQKHIATSNGNQSDDFAVASMAETRATSKACRKALGWVVKMAGLNPTPFEDMPKRK
jgi:hypothetical protein